MFSVMTRKAASSFLQDHGKHVQLPTGSHTHRTDSLRVFVFTARLPETSMSPMREGMSGHVAHPWLSGLSTSSQSCSSKLKIGDEAGEK